MSSITKRDQSIRNYIPNFFFNNEMLSKKTFSFRQRVGHLNWKLVSGVDIFRVVDELQIDELQSVLDPVAFCEFTANDVRRNTVESITKLVQLMQLIIEYLLYSQETQMQMAKEIIKSNCDLKTKSKDLTRKNAACLEDIKIYKRQLTILKRSIKNPSAAIDPPKVLYQPAVSEEAPVDNKLNIERIVEPICQMIESVQRHERETREFVKTTLDERRETQNRNANKECEDMVSFMKSYFARQEFEFDERSKVLRMKEMGLNERQAALDRREAELNLTYVSMKERIKLLDEEILKSRTSAGMHTAEEHTIICQETSIPRKLEHSMEIKKNQSLSYIAISALFGVMRSSRCIIFLFIY